MIPNFRARGAGAGALAAREDEGARDRALRGLSNGRGGQSRGCAVHGMATHRSRRTSWVMEGGVMQDSTRMSPYVGSATRACPPGTCIRQPMTCTRGWDHVMGSLRVTSHNGRTPQVHMLPRPWRGQCRCGGGTTTDTRGCVRSTVGLGAGHRHHRLGGVTARPHTAFVGVIRPARPFVYAYA